MPCSAVTAAFALQYTCSSHALCNKHAAPTHIVDLAPPLLQAIKRREAEQERDQAQRLLEQYKAAAARSGTLAEAGKAAAAAPAAGSPTPAAAPAADDSEAAGPQPVSSWRRRRSSTGAIYSAGSYWFGGGAAAAAAAAPEAAPPAPPAAPAAPPAVTASSPEPSGPSASSSMASSRAPARMLGGATLAGGAMYPSSPAMLPGAAAAAAAVAAAADVPPARLPPMRNISGSSTGSGRARRSSLPAYMYKGAFPNPDVQIDCRDMSYVAGEWRVPWCCMVCVLWVQGAVPTCCAYVLCLRAVPAGRLWGVRAGVGGCGAEMCAGPCANVWCFCVSWKGTSLHRCRAVPCRA